MPYNFYNVNKVSKKIQNALIGGYGSPYGSSVNKRQPIGRSQKAAVRISQKGRCKDCRKVLTVEEYHHIKHVSKGGKSTTRNLVALCPECHRKIHIKEAALKSDRKKSKRVNKSPFYNFD